MSMEKNDGQLIFLKLFKFDIQLLLSHICSIHRKSALTMGSIDSMWLPVRKIDRSLEKLMCPICAIMCFYVLHAESLTKYLRIALRLSIPWFCYRSELTKSWNDCLSMSGTYLNPHYWSSIFIGFWVLTKLVQRTICARRMIRMMNMRTIQILLLGFRSVQVMFTAVVQVFPSCWITIP